MYYSSLTSSGLLESLGISELCVVFAAILIVSHAIKMHLRVKKPLKGFDAIMTFIKKRRYLP